MGDQPAWENKEYKQVANNKHETFTITLQEFKVGRVWWLGVGGWAYVLKKCFAVETEELQAH